jgi:hypothetical protein
MVELESVLPRLHQWAKEFEAGPPPLLDRKLVHKDYEQNVFVSRYEAVDEDHPDDFIGQLFIDKTHPFFFEHPLDHVPGLMLVEAGRQLGTAVAHTAYGVPLGERVFILNGMEVDFTGFAELDQPVFVNSHVSEKKFKRDMLSEMFYHGNFVQNDQNIGFMSGRWNIYDKRVMKRMRRNAVMSG